MKLVPHESAAAFLEVAEPFLQARESQNSLPLGIALGAREGGNPGVEGTRCFSLVEGGELAGAAMQTPGRAIVFTEMSAEAARCAADELPQHLDPLIGCLGPVEVADLVASLWREAGRGELGVHMSMRLFELTELIPARPAPGRLRQATEADLELARLWVHRFTVDCKLPEATPGELPERVPVVERGSLYFWEVEGEPVSCAAWARPMREGITIGYVYTPDELRGRGHASSAVGALSAGLLDGSLYQPARKRVMLYTDLANPTSNSIYRKLGYRPLGDHRHYMFAE